MAKKTKAQIKTLENEISELKDKYLRLAAEFENYKKRTRKEKQDSIKYGKESIVNPILTILDDFDRAKKTNEKDVKGYLLISQKFQDILFKHNLKRIEIKTLETFDVEKHEAISSLDVKDKKKKGKVIEEIEAGYLLDEKIIRYPKVIIGK
ncbi:MAG: nucleotide exchange factor GrpE [Flavobacteriales bacterium TMED191]|nr:MAG: nucleotide exchange factor GrpE [Flavobacteriales bacterium TMED191]|tara:strand:+ start:4245 stop:4697 length:453 start_codon:yes stop_codon:yes gene_type:complete